MTKRCIMKTILFSSLSMGFFLSLSTSALAAGDLCTDAVTHLVKAKKISENFAFDSSMKKVDEATKFNLGNERMTSETKDRLGLEILKRNEQISRYTVTNQVNCEKHCDNLELILDVDYASGECKVTNAQYSENLLQRTLFNREVCQQLEQKPRSQFLTENPDWMKKFKIRAKNSEKPMDLLRQLSANCKAYEKYYRIGNGSSSSHEPVGKASSTK